MVKNTQMNDTMYGNNYSLLPHQSRADVVRVTPQFRFIYIP